MTLHTKILDAARDEVAREMTYINWEEFQNSQDASMKYHSLKMHEQAALLAMERQASFYEWVSGMGYVQGDKYWHVPYVRGNEHTLLELYNIWKEGK